MGAADTKKLRHFLVEKAAPGSVRLDPLAIDHELGDGPFAYMPDDFLGGTGAALDVNFSVGNLVLLKKSFGLAAISAPGGGIHQTEHQTRPVGGHRDPQGVR